MTPPIEKAKRSTVQLTQGSRIHLRSAGPDRTAIESHGTYRGLVSVGGDNFLAIELDGSDPDPKGRVRLVPLSAMLAIDIVEAHAVEEEKRRDPPASPGYFG
jgi:hypothetical protein